MRKFYLTALSLVTGLFAFGQTDIIADHTEQNMTNLATAATYITGGPTTGYVSGTNGLGAEVIVQKFDMANGVQANGSIDAVRVWIPVKNDAGNGTSVDIVIYDDNSGAPGTVLGTQTVTLANIDTALASTSIMNDGTNDIGIYNVEVTFTGVNIPTNMTFWAGVDVSNTGNGDTVVVMTTAASGFGGHYDFPNASTHAGVYSSLAGFFSYPTVNAALTMANFIYPVVTYTNLGLEEEASNEYAVKAYPNPASDNFRIELPDSRTRTISLISITGQVLKTIAVNNLNVTMNVSDLENGVYMYQLKDDNGSVITTKKLVVRK